MDVDLRLLRAEIDKELLKIEEREELLLSQLSNVRSIMGFLDENPPIRENCAAGFVDQTGLVDPSQRPRSKSRSSGIRVCPRCDVKVLPTMDGRCPSCQNEFQR